MRKVVMNMMVSTDGFTQGPGGPDDWSWHVFDAGMERYSHELVDNMDLAIMGRLTYQLLSKFWLDQTGDFAEKFNRQPKIVYTRTLEKVEGWNARRGGENIAGEIAALKMQPGKDIWLAGTNLITTFAELDLIDEYRLIVNPVILGGGGKPIFHGMKRLRSLKLLDTRAFACGNVMLRYAPDRRNAGETDR